ncbi:uncharacterized protein TRAVEDRAFT_78249, partial [Trametes versicolor FP-101664 SS1]|uniref:uncharacterized protein n=1 Tax=Trametes versicolor (strain FP-101664) TaxID=717944 RepID=UPI0004621DB4
SVFTTPNQDWIPEFAIAHREITTYADGRWGRHEYSRWPQAYSRDCLHVACIPSRPSTSNGPSTVLWRTITPEDWILEKCGVSGLGFLAKERMKEIEDEASAAIGRFSRRRRQDKQWTQVGKLLVICLRHVIDRLHNIPASKVVVISLAAHAQRLILELAGLHVLLNTVLGRIESQENHQSEVLAVLGAHTSDPSIAQVLFEAGIPVWFQQLLTDRLNVFKVVTKTDIPPEFSTIPSYPRLVLAQNDTSGVLNTPGAWIPAMNAIVRQQLCGSSLPEVSHEEPSGERPSKRAREEPSQGKDSENCTSSKTVGDEPASMASSRPAQKPFFMNPFRQFYPSHTVSTADAWSKALRNAGPLPQPAQSATFYHPPPWLLDSLVEYDSNPNRIARNLHHLISIRTFCRLRLFDYTIAGLPLTSAEWRDALFGEYNFEVTQGSGDTTNNTVVRHKLKQTVVRFFGKIPRLHSYDPSSAPELAGRTVTYEAALTDKEIQGRLVWEAHEVNWRCELLALDALMVGSKGWSELERWVREADVSRVWGPGSSGMDIAPREGDMERFCWSVPGEPGWEGCRERLQAFLEVLGRWEGCPAELTKPSDAALRCEAAEYVRLMECAVEFYVRTFIAKYQRLPIPP